MKKYLMGLGCATAIAIALVLTVAGPRLNARAADTKEEGARPGDAMSFAELFPKVVDNVMPSVVSISTTKKVKRPEFELPFDFWPFEEPQGLPYERRRAIPRERYREYTQRSLGSGFVIRKEGWVATNNHVVRDVEAGDIKVIFSEPQKDGQTEFKAVTVYKDPNTDIAVVKIEGGIFKALPLGDSSKVRRGEWVLAVGSPLGFGNSVTAGIISATTTRGRVLGGEEPGSLRALPSPFASEDYLQTDASINVGNSGGPLVNLAGEVIAVNTLIVSPTGASAGLGFAIPSNTVNKILDELISKGKVTRGYVGVKILDVSDLNDEAAWQLFHETNADKLRDEYRLKPTDKGAFVADVMPDAPAEKGGVERGDLIVEIDGKAITSSAELKALVETKKPATEVKVKVQRKGRPVELKVAIGEQPTGEEVVALAEGRYPAERLGLTVQQITPAIAKALGLAKQEGVVVTDVAENGPADKAGIEVNDVILRVGKKQVRNLNDFKAAVEESRKEKEIALFIKRGDEPGGYVDLKL